MNRFVFALVALCLIQRPIPASACSCAPGIRPFAAAAREARYVVIARVIRHKRSWLLGGRKNLELAIEAVLVGPPDLHTLVVTGGKRNECRHTAAAFPVGTRWVLAVSSYGAPTDLALSNCSESALALDDDMVTGIIRIDASGGAVRESIPLEDLRTLLEPHLR